MGRASTIRWDYVAVMGFLLGGTILPFAGHITQYLTNSLSDHSKMMQEQREASSFEELLELSAHNGISWLYSRALVAGLFAVIALSFMKTRWIRRLGKLAVILLFSVMATHFANLEIQEKWRIRYEWATFHSSKMTDASFERLNFGDGANQSLGPFLFGFMAFLLLVATAGAASIVRMALTDWQSRRAAAQRMSSDTMPSATMMTEKRQSTDDAP